VLWRHLSILRGVYSDTTELNWPNWTAYSQVSRVFVYYVTTYKLSQQFTLSSSVELSWVELSCVAINGPLSTRSAVAYRVVEMMEIKCGLNAVMFFVFANVRSVWGQLLFLLMSEWTKFVCIWQNIYGNKYLLKLLTSRRSACFMLLHMWLDEGIIFAALCYARGACLSVRLAIRHVHVGIFCRNE